MWFANDDEVDDGENIVPMSDVLKNKIDADFDQINRLLENRRGKKERLMQSNLIILTLDTRTNLL